MKCNLPYVDAFRDRHGKLRFYFRRKGKRFALPGEPGSAEFLEAYQAVLNDKPGVHAIRAKAGTFDALRELYLRSAEFQSLRPTTQREMRYALDAICLRRNKSGIGKIGDNPVNKLERKHILEWRDSMATKPGASNKMLRVLKTVLTFAVNRGYRKDNPAHGIKEFKGGRFRSWTDDELLAFEARWPLGTIQRTGYALALYTAQRRADLVTMKWSDIASDAIVMRQSKTGTDLTLPIHPELQKALTAVRPRSDKAIITGPGMTALGPIYFGAIMAEAIEKAGLPQACVLHGLRKSAARIIAELGHKVGSMTGHLTPKMEQEYARDASQKHLARATVLAWGAQSRRKKRVTPKG
jgi:integrase